MNNHELEVLPFRFCRKVFLIIFDRAKSKILCEVFVKKGLHLWSDLSFFIQTLTLLCVQFDHGPANQQVFCCCFVFAFIFFSCSHEFLTQLCLYEHWYDSITRILRKEINLKRTSPCLRWSGFPLKINWNKFRNIIMDWATIRTLFDLF